MSHKLLFLALVCVSALALSHASDDSEAARFDAADDSALELTSFAAKDFFLGEWEVYRHVVTSAGVHFGHSLPAMRWKLENENTTANLVGRAYLNASSAGYDADDALALRVEFPDGAESSASGSFQVGRDEDNLATLFSFQFVQPRSSIPVAAGRWLGADLAGDDAATYVLQAVAPERFSLLVTPSGGMSLKRASQPTPAQQEQKKQQQQQRKAASDDDDDEDGMQSSGPASTGHPLLTAEELAALGSEGVAFLYIGHRVKVDAPQSLFQKYGTMILLGGMLLLNVYMRTRGSSQSLAANANRSAAAQMQAVRAAKKPATGGARVEEITEGDISLSGDNKKAQ